MTADERAELGQLRHFMPMHVYPLWGPEHVFDGAHRCWCDPCRQVLADGSILWVHHEPPN